MPLIKKRGLFNLETPLGGVPRLWLRDIEPKIIREGFGGCWIWTGTIDRSGYGILKWTEGDKRVSVMVHRYVASMFWEFPEAARVRQKCFVRNCLNPHHIYVKE